MPIYEYQCGACGHKLEALQKISDDPLKDCPACQQAALKKLLSASAFRLGGSGWYETDFKSGNKKNLAGESDSKPKSGDTAEKAASTPKASSDSAGSKASGTEASA